MFVGGYLQCQLVQCIVCKRFALDCWSICKDLKPEALLVCKDRWLRNTAVCKPVPYCSQAATPSVARAVFHGHRGELRQRYREGQEDQLGALGLVVNAIVLWNTLYMEAALQQLREEGAEVRDEDVARLSPLVHHHINFQGRYSFALSEAVARGELRPLHDPDEWDV